MSTYTKKVAFAPGALYEKKLLPSQGYSGVWVRCLDWEPKVVDMRNRHKPHIAYYATYTIRSECILT